MSKEPADNAILVNLTDESRERNPGCISLVLFVIFIFVLSRAVHALEDIVTELKDIRYGVQQLPVKK